MLGARRLLRIGTCGGLSATLSLGRLVIATEAIGDDGTSRALSGSAPAGGPLATREARRLPADAELVAALQAAAKIRATAGPDAAAGPIVSTDLFYDAEDRIDGWIAAGALAVEMETATLFTLAAKRGVQAACVVLVSNMLVGATDYIDAEALQAAEVSLGELAVAALS